MGLVSDCETRQGMRKGDREGVAVCETRHENGDRGVGV